MKDIQSRINAIAEGEARKRINELFNSLEDSLSFNLKNKIVIEGKGHTIYSIISELRQAALVFEIPAAQEQASKDFLEKVNRLSSEVEELQSCIGQ